MNKAKLKTYAPQARKDFIADVTARAHRIGLAEKDGSVEIAPAEKSGDFVIIAGQSWPAKISRQRDNLIELIERDGFNQTMEAVAYSWFNRFAALRYMEIHDYLNHGYRVLSSREGGLPEILNAAPELAQKRELPDLNPQQVIELKLAGDQDGELYRLTLIAQCNALSTVMPFLFERIDNETELLLPDNLLRTDSVIAKLIEAIPEEDWSQIEIIGWLYQFYISEKKDQVIGKVVKSEDIPAATQLFTPNWIVQYLVQNSVGRLWLMANPASTLKNQWPYYIEPAEQTPEVQAQLDALIQTRMDEDGGSLNPESITILDPACGSGHILVEAYEVLKAIYLERGYQLRSIPRLILENNLFGMDIDDRAAQLASFALLMKARADDRRLLDNPPKLNVLALQESKGLDIDELTQALSGYVTLTRPTITSLIDTFAYAKTFGSLIQIPSDLNVQLATMDAGLQLAIQSGDLLAQSAALNLLPLVRQARILGMQFDAVVANPPYMGGKGMNAEVKDFAKRSFIDSKSDMFSMFMERGFYWCKPTGFNSMVTMQSWMFLSSYKVMRENLLTNRTISNFLQIGYNSFPEINSKVAQACAFSIVATHIQSFTGRYIDLNSAPQSADKNQIFLERTKEIVHDVCQDDFKKIPGSPVAYWANKTAIAAFSLAKSLKEIINPKQGTSTGDDETYIRLWHEVLSQNIGYGSKSLNDALQSGKKYFPIDKGGEFRRWFGNNEKVIKMDKSSYDELLTMGNHLPSKEMYFRAGLTWSKITSGDFSVRFSPIGSVFSSVGLKGFPNEEKLLVSLAFMNTCVMQYFVSLISPTLSIISGDIEKIPFLIPIDEKFSAVNEIANKAVKISSEAWNSYERSWGFTNNPLISNKQNTLETAYMQWQTQNCGTIIEMQRLEEENNRIFIEAYGLQDELTPEVPVTQITLALADREKDCQRLISYAVGCMMGRYNLDEPGLIYAHAGNVDFDSARYKTFLADADGIVPITDELWFEDDAANRIREFLLAVWNNPSPQPSPQGEGVEANIAWLAESLGQKDNETPIETIRRYLAGSFFREHLQTYKKRPIYWLFSSGKQGAFQALVYLHRYHESTLARMRAEYVVPLTGKIQSRIEMLEKDAAVAASNAARNKLNKDIEKLKKKHVELLAYDEKLRHYADLRIQLDLDDGVKVNYGKFGDLLADVKAVTGGKDE